MKREPVCKCTRVALSVDAICDTIAPIMIIKPADPKKQLKISNIRNYLDHTSLFRHVVREIVKAKWCGRQELIAHWNILTAIELSPKAFAGKKKIVPKKKA